MTTMVVDGDWLAFLGACMTHPQHFIVCDSEGTEILATTSKRALDKLVAQYDEDEITVSQERRLIPDWEATAKGVMLGKAYKLKRECEADKILVAMGGPTNFRDDLKLLYSKYKERSASYRPPNLKEVRALLLKLLPHEISIDCEADDIISKYQFKGRLDKSYIVVTEDKDAKQTPRILIQSSKLRSKGLFRFWSYRVNYKSKC